MSGVWRSCLTVIALVSLLITVPLTMYTIAAFGRLLDEREYGHPGVFWITQHGEYVLVAMWIGAASVVLATGWLVYRVWRSFKG